MNQPLKFLHLTTFYPPYSFGGDAMYIYRLAHALGDAGHKVDVIHCIDSYHVLHPGDPEITYADHPNVKVHGLRSGYKWLSPLLSQQSGRPLLKNRSIREVMNARGPYDVVHYHNISLLGPDVLTLQSETGDRPIKLYTTHEHWLICPTHVLWKYNSRPCEKPDCFRCTIKAGRPPQLWRYSGLLERASRNVDRFLSPSRFTAEMHARRGFPRAVGHLPYFIDQSDQDWQRPAARPHERPYFLFVGRLEEIKGLQTLIEVWKRVKEDIDLVVVGTGDYEPQLRSQAAGNERIRFAGALPQRDLGAFYFHSLACIVPSLTYETFGMIIIEAFARKTPAIVRNLGALPEVIHESGGGRVFNNDDELLSSISQIASSPRLREELGGEGYKAFVQKWSRGAHLEMYSDVLREVAVQRNSYDPGVTPHMEPIAQANT